MRRLIHHWLFILCLFLAACQTLPPEQTALQPVSTLKIEQYPGKLVVLGFWVEWCNHCETYLPWLDRLSQRLPTTSKAIVAGVSMGYDTLL